MQATHLLSRCGRNVRHELFLCHNLYNKQSFVEHAFYGQVNKKDQTPFRTPKQKRVTQKAVWLINHKVLSDMGYILDKESGLIIKDWSNEQKAHLQVSEKDWQLMETSAKALLFPEKEPPQTFSAKSISRAKSKIFSLVDRNCHRQLKFLTLTFAKKPSNFQEALDKLNGWGKFMNTKFNREYRLANGDRVKQFEYIAIPELGEKNGRLHFHLIAIVPFINLRRHPNCYWKWGNADIKLIKNKRNLQKAVVVAKYVAKYMTKDAKKISGQKMLYYSTKGWQRDVLKAVATPSFVKALASSFSRDNAKSFYKNFSAYDTKINGITCPVDANHPMGAVLERRAVTFDDFSVHPLPPQNFVRKAFFIQKNTTVAEQKKYWHTFGTLYQTQFIVGKSKAQKRQSEQLKSLLEINKTFTENQDTAKLHANVKQFLENNNLAYAIPLYQKQRERVAPLAVLLPVPEKIKALPLNLYGEVAEKNPKVLDACFFFANRHTTKQNQIATESVAKELVCKILSA
ncbi:MAG: hypothetical protein R3Y36_03690 [Spirochaetales bacterium]